MQTEDQKGVHASEACLSSLQCRDFVRHCGHFHVSELSVPALELDALDILLPHSQHETCRRPCGRIPSVCKSFFACLFESRSTLEKHQLSATAPNRGFSCAPGSEVLACKPIFLCCAFFLRATAMHRVLVGGCPNLRGRILFPMNRHQPCNFTERMGWCVTIADHSKKKVRVKGSGI